MGSFRGSEWRQWDLHVHTASSYDSDYKGADADNLLVNAWKENGIQAVAITDHFIIDSNRINNLRRLANNDVLIFPGVEMRCDKATNNLHLILVFSNDIDVDSLATDFKCMMLDRKAKASESNDTIFWDFNDIVSYAKEKKALISIHAGKKTSGLDKCITNATPFEIAVKNDFATNIHIFEMGKVSDIADYNIHVIPKIGPRPMIICSDNHDPRVYTRKEKLWIKADLTFNGLLQVLNHPEERVFVGPIPPKLDMAIKKKSVYIDTIKVKRISDPRNTDSNWFNFELPINNGLSVVIGNKGSGKSAFADILGHLCDSNSMDEASFLTADRFRKPPERYSDDYIGSIKWLDEKENEYISLGKRSLLSTTQYAQYLPQKFTERICTDLGKQFQEEINKVIFSYVDDTEKGDAKTLDELIQKKAHPYLSKIRTLIEELSDLNQSIIILEKRLTNQYSREVQDKLSKATEMLTRHLQTKPVEVQKPESKLNEDDQKALNELDEKIKVIEASIVNTRRLLTQINSDIDTLLNLDSDITLLENSITNVNGKLKEAAEKFFNNDLELKITYETPKVILNEKITELKLQKQRLQDLLDDDESAPELSLYTQQKSVITMKAAIVEKADAKEKEYQKYLADLKQWEITKLNLEGTETTEGTVNFYLIEMNKITNIYPVEYAQKTENRRLKLEEIFEQKKQIISVYSDIYSPVERELETILHNMEDKVNFQAKITLKDTDIGNKLLNYINHSYSGIFSGKENAAIKMQEFIRETSFNDFNSIQSFFYNVIQVVTNDIDRSIEIVKDKLGFYQTLCSLEYLNVEYNLNYGGRELMQLSPGERGIILLIFYLALNKGEEPLIIDQPEDNLDNESVFNKLVPCIIEAKKKRQVIIVTHNPNIAIACDAEQVIHCKINKSKNEIKYYSGSIEDNDTRQRIIDVLEGTEPAFTLRRKKYMF
jgi:ABC-type lipoprotein export system ATPase subunit